MSKVSRTCFLLDHIKNDLTPKGDRFGGALDGAAKMFSKAYDAGQTPNEFVTETKKQHKLIMGIGHRVKSVINFDRCVQGRTLSFNPWTSQTSPHSILKLGSQIRFSDQQSRQAC